MSNRVPLILDGYSLKDQCSAAELTNGVFALVRARIAWREALSWPGPLVEPPRQISEDVPSPSIVLWELALKLRMGAQHARGAIQAGFLVYAAKLLTWSPRDEQLRDRFLCEAKYGNDYHGQWKYVRDATDCELTLSMLLELARHVKHPRSPTPRLCLPIT